jgi:hypothetical protein
VFIAVVRGPGQSVEVRFNDRDAIAHLRIEVDADVSEGEESRALFEAGAAVQRSGSDYLISVDWLLRQAPRSAPRLAEWESLLHDLVTDAGRPLYVKSVDAIRADVVRAVSASGDDDPQRQADPRVHGG